MLIILADASDAYELARTGTVTSSVTLDALTQWIWVPPVGLLGIYLILLFPDGRLPSRRWRPFAWFAGAVIILTSVAVTTSPGPLPDHPGMSNPFGLEGHSIVAQTLLSAPLLLPICILAAVSAWYGATSIPVERCVCRSDGWPSPLHWWALRTRSPWLANSSSYRKP
jgi:hypothetical protein